MSQVIEVKKRTRKKKNEVSNPSIENIQLHVEESTSNQVVDVKKRGRKPKGGKLLPNNQTTLPEIPPIQNIILH